MKKKQTGYDSYRQKLGRRNSIGLTEVNQFCNSFVYETSFLRKYSI